MAESKQSIDIAKNLKIIDWLKTELIEGVANFHKAILKNSEELILDALAGIVVVCYLLARRLGVQFTRLDKKVRQKVDYHIENKHEVELWYGDLSSLQEYLKDREQAK